MLLDLKEDVEWLDEATVISGKIDYPAGTPEEIRRLPMVVGLVLRKPDGEYEIDTYSVQYGPGEFKLVRRKGEFYLMAFADANEDLTFQHNEYVGWYGKPSPVHAVRGGDDLTDMDIVLRPPNRARIELPAIYAPKLKPVRALRDTINVGELTSIDDRRFSPEIASMGLWEPVQFVKEGNSGIFLLEPYDAGKIPVLLVHGIGGAAHEWRSVVAALDRDRYQPWLVQYPSGMRLDLLSRTVNQGLTELQVKYRVDSLYVVAHSMGGLLARGFINESRRRNSNSPVQKFVTISTPWGGHMAAEMGVDRAPVVVPVWYDMAPSSAYIQGLFATVWPDDLPFYLLFTHKGSSSILTGGNSDGAVSIASQLAEPAQLAANLQLGFNEDHTGILKSTDLHDTLNALLDGSHCKLKRANTGAISSGPCP
ncbi:MAG: lipase family alpha/beta hydrolase [Pseudomonadales bacterium]